MKTLTETVTVQREVPRQIADLVNFVIQLRDNGTDIFNQSDEMLIEKARRFWDTQHGEE
jgi:hypothetical protein